MSRFMFEVMVRIVALGTGDGITEEDAVMLAEVLCSDCKLQELDLSGTTIPPLV